MKYRVKVYDVRCSAEVEIEADNKHDAIRKAREGTQSLEFSQPIVSPIYIAHEIEDETKNTKVIIGNLLFFQYSSEYHIN